MKRESLMLMVLATAIAAAAAPGASALELGGQHSALNSPVTLTTGNAWTTLNFGSTPLNTPGTTPNVAWDNGLYLISGTLSHPGANNHVVTRLTVSGTPVTTSIQGNTAYGGNRLSHVGLLSAGDAVQFQYRTPAAGITVNPPTDWHSGTLNLLSGLNLANAQRSALGGVVNLSNSNTWATLPLTSTPLNTPGTTPNAIWSDGLYVIKGSIAAPGGNSHLVSRLTVNGVPVEKSIQGNTAYGTNSLSHVGMFNTGDTIELQYRTPAAISLNPATDWQSASLSLIELEAADAQRSELANAVTLNNSNSWTNLSLTNTTLNTPGTTPHVAWEEGLYLVTASLSGPQAGQSAGLAHVVTRLLVNGNPVEESIQGNTSYGTNLLEHLAYLNAGDTISFQYRTAQANLTVNPGSDWQGASLSLVRFQVIPEPTTCLIWSLLTTLGLSLGWRQRKR
jgi:hypothetical protein